MPTLRDTLTAKEGIRNAIPTPVLSLASLTARVTKSDRLPSVTNDGESPLEEGPSIRIYVRDIPVLRWCCSSARRTKRLKSL